MVFGRAQYADAKCDLTQVNIHTDKFFGFGISIELSGPLLSTFT